MSFDLGSIRRQNIAAKQSDDPEQIFKRLPIKDPLVGFLRAPQADALRVWYGNRDSPETLLQLSTGAGKTLLALLCAESVLAARLGKVLYACSTIQLVEQTAEKAASYGIDVTTYLESDFSDGGFAAGRNPCITTYNGAFHAFSKFKQHDIGLLILDDAHTAQSVFRGMYLLELTREEFPTAISSIASLFEPYFAAVGQNVSFLELTAGIGQTQKLLPPYEVLANLSSLQGELLRLRLHDHRKLKYAWAFLADKLKHCCFFLHNAGLTITPPIVPIRTNEVFSGASRRLYLSATLSAADNFVRAFGASPTQIITPQSDSDEPERLIIFANLVAEKSATDDSLDVAKHLCEPYKALIVVPSYARAHEWSDVADPPPQNANLHSIITDFRKSQGNQKLLLVARFDGVDLPGDDCHVMVIDDRPSGIDALERFLWDGLGIKTSLRSLVASRITQIFGRITRDPRDYGVYFLSGDRLIEWITDPDNSALLPDGLRRQIRAGENITAQLPSMEITDQVVAKCLSRKSEDWRRLYQDEMAVDYPVPLINLEPLRDVATQEVLLHEAMWCGDYSKALHNIDGAIDRANRDVSARLAAWIAYWSAHGYALAGDPKSSERLYSRASGLAPNILKRPRSSDAASSVGQNQQVANLCVLLRFIDRKEPVLAEVARARVVFSYLEPTYCKNANDSAPDVEGALGLLGSFLGFESSRPDKENRGAGPDVLWSLGGFPVLGLEAKSNKYKTAQPRYSKADFTQYDDHRRWARRRDADDLEITFVGPAAPAASQATASIGASIITLDELSRVALDTLAAIEDAVNSSLPMTLAAELFTRLERLDVLYPNFPSSLPRHLFEQS
jgi:hypothetical protein